MVSPRDALARGCSREAVLSPGGALVKGAFAGDALARRCSRKKALSPGALSPEGGLAKGCSRQAVLSPRVLSSCGALGKFRSIFKPKTFRKHNIALLICSLKRAMDIPKLVPG